jgi:hypothetical protein
MLSPNEFRNAIYLDFEGEGQKSDGTVPMPHMAGLFRPNQTRKSGQYTCAFFKQSWKPASNGIKVAQCVTFDELFAELAIELEKKDGYLVYWTIHEQIILQEYLSDELYARLAPRLFNLHPIAKKYANRKRLFGSNMSAKKRTLEEFFAAMYSKRNPYPPFPLGAAEACRRIDKVCNTNNRWKRFSERQKAYVLDLVAYNQGDCRSTWLIAKRLGNFYDLA